MKKLKSNSLFEYFPVFKNGTAVIRVSSNDFKPSIAHMFHSQASPNGKGSNSAFKLSLPKDADMYYGYSNQAYAMECAKKGALKYIDLLIGLGDAGSKVLQQYRIDHYADLNFNLLDSNIRAMDEHQKQLASKNSLPTKQ